LGAPERGITHSDPNSAELKNKVRVLLRGFCEAGGEAVPARTGKKGKPTSSSNIPKGGEAFHNPMEKNCRCIARRKVGGKTN